MDPQIIKTAAEIGATAYAIEKAGGRDLIVRFLGPTIDYFGQSTQYLVQKGAENVGAVLKNAIAKLGDEIHTDGKINPRVLKDILSEAAFCENKFMTEYYGGLLAASRSVNIDDDKTVSYTKLVSSMSVVQVKAHYVLYSIIRKIYVGKIDQNIGTVEGRNRLKTYIPENVFLHAMGTLTGNDVTHIFFGLNRLDLLEPMSGWRIGDLEEVKRGYPKAEQGGIIFTPSALGAELFLLAHGFGNKDINDIFKTDVGFELVEPIEIQDGAKSIFVEMGSHD